MPKYYMRVSRAEYENPYTTCGNLIQKSDREYWEEKGYIILVQKRSPWRLETPSEKVRVEGERWW